jgi:hypothetical protein
LVVDDDDDVSVKAFNSGN